jgi:putative MATE family efflux protein
LNQQKRSFGILTNRTELANLTEGPVGRTLIRLTIPMLFAILAMVVFNLVDTAFVGRLGTKELAAISFTFPVILVINSLAGGLGVGASAVISQAIGKGDRYRVQRLTTDSLALAVMVVAFFSLVGLATIDPLFRLLGATPDVLPLIRQYMTLWYIGVIFVVIPMVGNAAIRATGDTKTPAAIMMVAAGVNLALDPLLIFGIGSFPGLGLTGAALATVIARAITLIASLWVLVRRERMVIWSRPKLKEVSRSWNQVLYVGLPAAGTNVLVPISAGIITGMVAAYGPEAVAALGVGTRIESMGLGVIMALASVLTPFVGQNWGAGRLDRVRLSVSYAQRFALLWGAVLFILLAVSGRSVALIFNDDAIVVATLVDYLRIVPLSYGLLGVLMLATAALNALNRPLQSALLTVLRLFVLYIPLAIVGSVLFGLQGIFGAAAIANGLAGVAAFFWLRSILTGSSLRRQASTSAEVGEKLPVAGD